MQSGEASTTRTPLRRNEEMYEKADFLKKVQIENSKHMI